jgi:hypothetical protein
MSDPTNMSMYDCFLLRCLAEDDTPERDSVGAYIPSKWHLHRINDHRVAPLEQTSQTTQKESNKQTPTA